MIKGFSKLSKVEKIDYIIERYFHDNDNQKSLLKNFWHEDENLQKTLDEFSENTISNFIFPYGVVPNFVLNNETLMVPMVIEESSVVAALSKASKFWATRGGFKSEVINTQKVGQVHFITHADKSKVERFFSEHKSTLIALASSLSESMEKRGGGLEDIKLIDLTDKEAGYYQLFATFQTCDAMGANYINTILEALGRYINERFKPIDLDIQIVMCILSNYTPNCIVRSWVECHVSELEVPSHHMSGADFANKIVRAVKIAKIDPYRATTHNKGIFNGVDGVVLATGNDFRAVEACGHAYASKSGQYSSLTSASFDKDSGMFRFEIELPLSLGTVGGLTKLHPLANFSLKLLGDPSAAKLMSIAATVGLAQNFAALRSLVTSGIQKGHMKMHLMNILNQLEANDSEKDHIKNLFNDKVVSFNDVKEAISDLRSLS